MVLEFALTIPSSAVSFTTPFLLKKKDSGSALEITLGDEQFKTKRLHLDFLDNTSIDKS